MRRCTPGIMASPSGVKPGNGCFSSIHTQRRLGTAMHELGQLSRESRRTASSEHRSRGGKFHILRAKGTTGDLEVNGEKIPRPGLLSTTGSGIVSLATGWKKDNRIEGGVTRYANFTVRTDDSVVAGAVDNPPARSMTPRRSILLHPLIKATAPTGRLVGKTSKIAPLTRRKPDSPDIGHKNTGTCTWTTAYTLNSIRVSNGIFIARASLRQC